MTPRQLDALIQRHERRTEHDEFMLAQLTSAVINFSMCRLQEPAKPSDFMPSKAKQKPRRKKMTRKDWMRADLMVTTLLGGRNG